MGRGRQGTEESLRGMVPLRRPTAFKVAHRSSSSRAHVGAAMLRTGHESSRKSRHCTAPTVVGGRHSP